MISPEEIVQLYHARRKLLAPRIARMEELRRAYMGELDIPLPELDRTEKPMVANLIAQGLDGTAQRISSTLPNVTCPPMRPGFANAETSAETRRNVIYGWWHMNKLSSIQRRRARWFVGYSSAPVMIRPDPLRSIPKWQERNPLTALPPPGDDLDPPNMIFSFKKSLAWLRHIYPDSIAGLDLGRPAGEVSPDTQFTVVEYADYDCVAQIVIGASPPNDQQQSSSIYAQPAGAPRPGRPWAEIEWQPNLAGICPVVNPTRISLDDPVGQFDGLIGLYYWQSRLMALGGIAAQRDVFPDEWLVERPNEMGAIEVEADGQQGIRGVVKGGQIQTTHAPPGQQTMGMINVMERNMRLSGGIPAEMTGECVDAETEILTPQGWRRYGEVSVGDEVLTLNHETGMSEWQLVLAMNVFPPAPRQVIEMEGPRFSALTTLNHRWPVVRRDVRGWRTSMDLTSNDQIPIAAMNADLPDEAKFSDALVEIVAWYYTEGSKRESGGQLTQSATRHPENAERIRAALTRLFGPPTTERWRDLSGCGRGGKGHDGVPRWKEHGPRSNGVLLFVLSKHAVDALEEQAPGKVPSFAFLRQLTAAQLELFLHISMLADNCGKASFGQKDPARAEAFAFAAILSGRGVSFRSRTKREQRPGWRSGDYVARIVRMRERTFVSPKENYYRGASCFRQVPFDGLVWCPTTPNGTWFARRRGAAYFTGNSPTNVRTARRGAQVLSSAIDFTIQEAQECFEASLEAENVRAIAIDKAYFGTMTKSYYFSWNNTKGRGTYVPDQTWDTDENEVEFAFPGSDINDLVVGAGQRLGMETMSHHRFMELDPLITDPELEKQRIISENLERGTLQALLQGVSTGSVPPSDAARISQLVLEKKKPLWEAIQVAQKEAQQRQATSGPPGTPTGPVAPGSPEAQPGLAQAGAGAEAGVDINAPSQSSQNLQQLLTNLRRPMTGVGASPAGG